MKTRLLLFFLLAVSMQSIAQIGFDENIVTGASYTTKYAQSVRAADLDGDGDLDIIVSGDELNWYENIDGLGNFGEKKTIAPYTYARTSVYTVDFDNDGDLDILNSMRNKFIIYKNTDGLGNFQVSQNFTLGTNAIQSPVVPTDIDNDGDMDVLGFYDTDARFLVWYQNNGTGTLGAEQIISNNGNLIATTSLFTKDLDGDNDEDIIFGSNTYGRIGWLKNNGNGTFSAAVFISSVASGISAIATSDMDNDGDMDIISTAVSDNQVVWYKNLNGSGNFSDENIIVPNATASNAVLVTDINNDNTNDVIYTKTNEIGWLSNNGSAVFGGQQTITNKAFGVKAVIMADLDGDGKKDLISASQEDDKVAWYKHDGNGNFGRQVVIARSVEFPNKVYPGDFDGDNDIDLLVTSQHDAKLTWLENINGLGFYGKEHIITENVGSGNSTPISYPVDIDGDGDLDIAVFKSSILFWYENIDGHGNFTAEHVIDSNSSPSIIRSQDLDGDGDMDLVCGVYNSDKISWYKNLGSGTFGPEQIIYDTGDDNGSLTSLEIADMDGDSDMDIIVSSYNAYTKYYKNTNGLGTFVYQYMPVFDAMQSVYPVDMDGDGDKDIVGVTENGGSPWEAVVWYENSNGQGNFTVQRDVSTLRVFGESIHTADIDNDGDMDVLTAGGDQNASGILIWYENNGTGTSFTRRIIHQAGDYSVALCVTTADIDHDNDLDVLGVFGYSGNSAVSKVAVYENLGTLGNMIQGKITIDSDSNGCTNTDIKGRNLMVISDNGSHSFATFTDQNGAYHVATTAGNFTTAITSQLPDYFVSNPSSHAFGFTGMNNTYEANFCVAPTGSINDLSVSVYPSLNDLRPGFVTHYRIVYRNMGTTTIPSGSVNFEYNNYKINFLTASQVVSSQSLNMLTFDFTNLKPFETKTIDLNFTVFSPPITNINDGVATTVTVNPILGDETAENNSFTLNQTVIGSHDPNDITCLEGNEVLIEDADKYLHYVVRFQNTGTASAINVKVENTLDNKLDWTSMQLESMSHNGRVEIKDGNEVKFIFNNINLPARTANEAQSHGFIAYKIKPLSNVAVGDVVNNTADIYFDFNPAIVTNTASTEFVGTLSVPVNDANSFNIYPNPATNLLNIKGSTLIDQVSLIDINGRILKEFHFNTPTSFAELDLTALTKGIYFLKIKSDLGHTTRKIIKR